jgi:hypothetical protein
MSDEAKRHLSKNKDLPELGETAEEALQKILYPLQREVTHWGDDSEAALEAFRAAAASSKAENNSKLNRIFVPLDYTIPRMLITLHRWGSHFRHSFAMEVGPLSKMIDVHGGVSLFLPFQLSHVLTQDIEVRCVDDIHRIFGARLPAYRNCE